MQKKIFSRILLPLFPFVFAGTSISDVVTQPDRLWETSRKYIKNPFQWPSVWTREPLPPVPGEANTVVAESQSKKPDEGLSPAQEAARRRDFLLEQAFLQKVSPLTEDVIANASSQDVMNTAATGSATGTDTPNPWKYHMAPHLTLKAPFLATRDEGWVFPGETPIDYHHDNDTEILQLFDEVTLERGLKSGLQPGMLFRVYELGRGHRKVISRASIGKLVEPKGVLKITSVSEKKSKGVLIQCFGTISRNALAAPLPASSGITATGYAQLEKGDRRASVVYVSQKQQLAQPFTYAIIDEGSEKGFKMGDLILVYNRIRGGMTDKVLASGLICNLQKESATVLLQDIFPGTLNRGDYIVAIQTPIP